ncbi:MAG: 3'(2'),5'-bisphosphate nucleotidase, partial [Proteobacteria bacterium]|nr:3'(2'),5'-bisphosphate nucleotidase [Pseudomonadota bacterium]
MMNYKHERQVAVEAIIKSCRLCQAIRKGGLFGETMKKEDQSPVTVADFGTQAVISRDLLKAFPDDPIMAEENLAGVPTDLQEKIVQHVNTIILGVSHKEVLAAIDRCNYNGGPAGRFWVLDPVDGTRGFLRGDQYAIALSLIEDGRVVLGVLGCPNLPFDMNQPDGPKGCIFISVNGQGAAMRLIDDPFEKKIEVADIDEPAMASFCESFESTHSSHTDSARVAHILGVNASPIRIDSQCKYGIVARSDASIYLRLPGKAEYQEKIWDHTVGWLMVKEAGGEVTDINGLPLDFSAGKLLSHNSGIV